MTEKYPLLPVNPQLLTPAQIALQRMSEKHPDFEIQAINTIRPPEKTWQETTKNVKELEHIIRKCDPPAAALPTLAKGTAVPGLY